MFKDMYEPKYYSKLYVTDNFYKDIFHPNLMQYISIFFGMNCEMIKINDAKENEFLNTINGVALKNNTLDQTTLINLLQYYLILNKLYVHNDSIYKKIEDTLISYSLVGTVKNILYDGFRENVIKYFSNNFSVYFLNFDFDYLLTSYLINSKHIIENIKDISINKIQLDLNIAEFIDGVYLIEYNIFIPKGRASTLSNKTTTKYYNMLYSSNKHTLRSSSVNII